MSNYNSLKSTIDANVKQNGVQAITGQILNSVLNAMVNTLGTGYSFAGVATTATNPGSPDAKVFYIANGKGTYTNFGGVLVTEDDVVVLYWDSSWHKMQTGIALNESISQLAEDVNRINEVIDFKDDNLLIKDFTVYTEYPGNFSDGGFLYLSAYGYHIEIPIPDGVNKVRIKNGVNVSKYALLSQHIGSNLSSAVIGAYVTDGNTQGVNLQPNEEITIDIPNGTKFLYARTRNGSNVDISMAEVEFPKQTNAIEELFRESILFSNLSLFENIGVIGDSYSSGAIIGMPGVSTGDHYGISWAQILARRNGITAKNYSTGGETPEDWLVRSGERGLSGMLSDNPMNLYFIKLGINGTYSSLGDISDCKLDWTQNANSFFGNYGRIIGNIMTHAPHAKIICLNNSVMSTEEKNSAIKQIADFYSVAFIDEFEDDFFSSDFYKNTMSGAHPIGITYAGMASAYERLFSACAIKYADYLKTYTGND